MPRTFHRATNLEVLGKSVLDVSKSACHHACFSALRNYTLPQPLTTTFRRRLEICFCEGVLQKHWWLKREKTHLCHS